MSRPIRIEFAHALYHVTAPGDRREDILEDHQDRRMFLSTLGQVITRFNWLCHAWCLMDNHYHLLVETPDGNLSKGMRQLNGVYTQASNRRHQRAGHLFQERFNAILVDSDAYLLELARYVVVNPVRAGIAKKRADRRWSSYRVCVELTPPAPRLAVDGLLTQFAKRRSVAPRRLTWQKSSVTPKTETPPSWPLTQRVGIRTNNSPITLKCTSPRLGKLAGAPGNGHLF